MPLPGEPLIAPAVLLGFGRPAGDPATRKLTVLLADGHAGHAAMVRTMLEASGHRCLLAAHWAAAAATIGRTPLDALVLDLGCPGAGRVDAVERLRRWQPPLNRLPVLVLAPWWDAGTERALREAGSDGLLIRPLAAAVLETALRLAVLARIPPAPLDAARREALRDLLGAGKLQERDIAVMTLAASLLATLRGTPGLPAVRDAAATVALACEGIGAAVAAAAARALEAAPDRRPALLPPLMSALVATRTALRRSPPLA